MVIVFYNFSMQRQYTVCWKNLKKNKNKKIKTKNKKTTVYICISYGLQVLSRLKRQFLQNSIFDQVTTFNQSMNKNILMKYGI